MTDLERFTQAYIEAIYFTDTGEGDQPPTDADLAPEARQTIEEDCADFWQANWETLERVEVDPVQAGHDFWLTRNRHGAGFWDRGLPEPESSELTANAEAYGSQYAYLGDDELMYVE